MFENFLTLESKMDLPKNLFERLYELRKVVHGMNDAVDICTRGLTSN